LQAQLHGDVPEGDPQSSKSDIMREIARKRKEELQPAMAQLRSAQMALKKAGIFTADVTNMQVAAIA
jgi:hypothetical protein